MENLEILQNFSDFLVSKEGFNPFLLLFFAFLGGLLSSISPCVLGLLPVNLAYIGTTNIKSKKEAFNKAGSFVLGVSAILALLGFFGSIAFAVFNQFRGEINLGVGIFIILMALALLEVIKIPLPRFVDQMPEANPFVIGMVFALISSPCVSPVLFAVLSLASSLGSAIWGVFIMFAYSIGYTALIFFASLFTGIMKQLNFFKEHDLIVTRVSAALLIVMGIFYAYYGSSLLWFNGS